MGVLRDLADERPPVGFGHPVLGLDLLLSIDPRLETRLQGGAILRRVLQTVFSKRIKALRIHVRTLRGAVPAASTLTHRPGIWHGGAVESGLAPTLEAAHENLHEPVGLEAVEHPMIDREGHVTAGPDGDRVSARFRHDDGPFFQLADAENG